MRVIGIDPGLTRTGYAVVEQRRGALVAVEAGTVRARAGETVPAQLRALRDGLAAVIERCAPQEAAIERIFLNANRTTAIRVGQASGVALLAAAEAGLEVSEYTPTEVKRAVVGVGGAAKDQVQYMVRAILGLRGKIDSADAADALAVAICHLHGRRLRPAAGESR